MPSDVSPRAGGCESWRSASAVELRYQGIPPVATCHWQWLANILAAQGFADPLDRLGLSWGCKWSGGPVLFGAATWPRLLRELTGTEVTILTFDDPAEARSTEICLSREGLLFIAEIDAFYIPAFNREAEHTVHAVLVVERDRDRVRIVDSTIGPEIMERSADEYEMMRASECRWRAERHKLYVVAGGPTVDPTPRRLLAVVRRDLDATINDSLSVLERYVAWAQETATAVDVCRVAGERFQAARLFDYLVKHGVEEAARPARLLVRLTEDWYLVHMLASHERGAESKLRDRVGRLMGRIVISESEAAAAVLG
jgi:hypothetical protein